MPHLTTEILEASAYIISQLLALQIGNLWLQRGETMQSAGGTYAGPAGVGGVSLLMLPCIACKACRLPSCVLCESQ